MKHVLIEIRGKSNEWGVPAVLSDEQIAAMRADGVEIGEIFYTIPSFLIGTPFFRVWIFAQDLWNFRNPFV